MYAFFRKSRIVVALLTSGLFALPTVHAEVPTPAALPSATAPIAPVPAIVAAEVATDSTTVELVFVLDTTGSMGGLLEGAKTKIWGIVNDILQKRSKVKVKVGLVAYRDRGDVYVTKVTPITDNLDDVYAELMRFRAEGGGDTPEDVRSAMQDALKKVGWSQARPQLSQIMFLVGDAPPHDDYQEVPDTITSAKLARSMGVIVNTIQCGNISKTTLPWRTIAQQGGGEYFAIEQNGGVQAIATPYDAELAALGEKMGATYMAYGHVVERGAKQAKQASVERMVSSFAPASARAERTLNKAINTSAYDRSDLLQQIESGSTSVDKIAEADLPDALQGLKPAERQAKLHKAMTERKMIRERILALSKQRDQYLLEQKGKTGLSKSGFDGAVSAALLTQIK